MSTRNRKYDLVLAAADYPSRPVPPKQTIVICSQQRSGSTLLGEAIYFAGGLGCPLEYFHGGFRPSFEARWGTRDFLSYLAKVREYRTDTTGVFSLKLFWVDVLDLAGELSPSEFSRLRLKSTLISIAQHRQIYSTISQTIPNPFFVFLRRRDEMRQAISLHIAAETRLWRKLPDTVGDKGAVAEYSFDKIVRHMAVIQNSNKQWIDFFRANDLSCYPMFYEDLAADYTATLRKLFLALGRSDAPIVPPRLTKQADAVSERFLERFMLEFRQEARGKRSSAT